MPQIAFSATKEEKDNAKIVASARGITVSEYIRGMVSAHVENDAAELEDIARIKDEIRADYKKGGIDVDGLKDKYGHHGFIDGRNGIRAILQG